MNEYFQLEQELLYRHGLRWRLGLIVRGLSHIVLRRVDIGDTLTHVAQEGPSSTE